MSYKTQISQLHYHFHIHYTRLEESDDINCQVERAHLLIDIIQNLQLDSNYYKKRTMTYKLGIKDKLYQRLAKNFAPKQQQQE